MTALNPKNSIHWALSWASTHDTTEVKLHLDLEALEGQEALEAQEGQGGQELNPNPAPLCTPENSQSNSPSLAVLVQFKQWSASVVDQQTVLLSLPIRSVKL